MTVKKLTLIAGAAIATLTATAADAAEFGLNGQFGQYSYTVATSGYYDLWAVGGRGGFSTLFDGGFGADVRGRVNLVAGSTLSIFVGDMGSPSFQENEGGGGGGTFVFLALPGGDTSSSSFTIANALIVAGGGGGAAFTAAGGDATGIDSLASGGLGAKTGGGFGAGGGGAGVSSDGTPSTFPVNAGYRFGDPGTSPANGGGDSGGFGDGAGGFGGGGDAGAFGGGGGGGFSGGRGGGGLVVTGYVGPFRLPTYGDYPQPADGSLGGAAGTSYLRADVLDGSFGLQRADTVGYFGITFSADQSAGAVPEPATWTMMIVGFGAIGGMARHRRRSMKVSFG